MINLPAPPPRIAKLPRNHAGYPIPWFVAIIDSRADFRVVGTGKVADAVRFRQCWICGGTLGANAAFIIGPMCAVNRISSEPPSHRDCAVYTAQVCPFLTTPAMRRRPDLPDGTVPPDGHMLTRNPGVALVWVTRNWRMAPGYELWDVGAPAEVRWYAHGRDATRTEVLAAIDSGMPELRNAAGQDPRADKALARLDQDYARAIHFIPRPEAEEGNAR